MGIRRVLPTAVLVTVLATLAVSSECPAKEELQNCECEAKATGGLAVHCYGDRDAGPSDITQLKTMLQEKFPSKAELDLYFENFQTRSNLTSKVFDGLRVRKLSFVRCRIDRWADKVGEPAFVGLEDSLEELEIQDSIHQQEKHSSFWRNIVSPFTLRHIRWLRKIKFSHNRLYNFGGDWFRGGGAAIEEVYLDDNEMEDLDDHVFLGLGNLRVLSVANNKLKRVAGLYHSKRLEKINVRNNKINRFVRGFFRGMPHLKEVDISGNPFMYLVEADWGMVWSKLTSIDVSGTHLHCDQHIDWMIHDSGPGPLSMRGECATPGNVAGKQLRKVIAERRLNGE